METKKPTRTGNLFWLASISKTVVGVSVMLLVVDGKLKLDEPVEMYLPEFKGQMLAEGKGHVETARAAASVRGARVHEPHVGPRDAGHDAAGLSPPCLAELTGRHLGQA